MGRLAIEITVVIGVFLLGYWMGFKSCFDFVDEEIQKNIERLQKKMEEDE